MQLAERNAISSLHLTFVTDEEWEFGGEIGLLQRTDQQFHWLNHGYRTWDDFLAALASRKRKNLRKERARAIENGIEIHWLTGDAIEPEHWDAFWIFYQDTGSRKWGRPYLTREFFDLAHERLRDDIPAGHVPPCRALDRRCPEPGRPPHALWPLLGLHRGSPLPAFRDLLLPGHRHMPSRTGSTASKPAPRAATSWPAATNPSRRAACTG